MQTITILCELAKTKEGKQFKAYKMNLKGRKVDLRFRQESDNVNVIPEGVSRVNVEGLSESKRHFYPTYYATFKGCVEREQQEMRVDDTTGEIIE